MNCNNNEGRGGHNDVDMNVCGKNINMLPMLQTYTTKLLKPNMQCGKNVLTQCMMSCENYKYVICWDFDLRGKTVTVPENCILEFDGGSLKNGTIIGQDTVFINVGDVDIWGENLTRLGTWREHSGGGGSSEEDKPYDPSKHSGLGRKTLQLKPDGSNILTQEDFDQSNTIYVVRYDFDLDGAEIQIPENCILDFEGGSITNGQLNSNKTVITGKVTDYSALFGVFFDEKDNIFMWDMHSITQCNSYMEYANGVKDIGLTPASGGMGPQALCMTEDYIFLFHNNGNSYGSAVVYDRYYSIIGIATINNSGHYNDATVYNGHIYIANTNNIPTFKINIADLVSAARAGSSVSATEINIPTLSIDYDPITNTFCCGVYVEGGSVHAIYDTEFNLIKKNNTTYQEIFAEYAPNGAYQSIVYRRGMVYILVSGKQTGWLYSTTSCVLVYDFSTDSVVGFYPIAEEVGDDELEGFCMDPLTNTMYINTIYPDYSSNWKFIISGVAFNVYEDTKNRKVNTRRSSLKSETRFIEHGSTAMLEGIYVNNSPIDGDGNSRSFNYKPDGSYERPYKTLGEALAMSNKAGILRLRLRNSPIEYYAYNPTFYGCNVWFDGQSASYDPNAATGVKLNAAISFVYGTLLVTKIKFDTTLYRSTAIIYCNYAQFYITDCVAAMSELATNQNNFINAENSKGYISGCTISGLDNETAAYGSSMTKSLVRGNNSDVDVHSGNYSHLNIFSKAGVDNQKFYFDQYTSGTITNCCLIKVDNDLRIDPMSVNLRRVTDAADLEKTIGLMSKGYDRQANFYIPRFLTLSNGASIPPGLYTNRRIDNVDVVTPVSGQGAAYTLTIGSIGPYSALANTPFGSLYNGQQYYDTTNNRILIKNESAWVDVEGNNSDAVHIEYESNGENLIVGSDYPILRDSSTLLSIPDGTWRKTALSTANPPTLVDVSVPDLPTVKKGFRFITTDHNDDIAYEISRTIGTYCLSCWAKGTGTVKLQMGGNSNYISKTVKIDSPNDFVFVSAVIEIDAQHAYSNGVSIYYGVLTGSDVTVCGMKVENGDKPTLFTSKNTYGPSTSRPTQSEIGAQYFDTTLGKPIYWTGDTTGGNSGWVDATGTNMPNP